MYDFDKLIDRKNTASLKWDVAENELPMWVADMDFATLPDITEALIERARHGIFGYSVIPDCWYESIIERWKDAHGFVMEKDWLIFSTGIVPAISSIVKRVTNVGDNIAVMTPVYDIFFHSIENFGRHTAECKLAYDGEKYSFDFAELERVLSDPLTTLLILCNPHNPVGKIPTRAELEKIGKLCKKYGVKVLSDEIHCDITEPSKHYVPFASVSECNREISITCISASKAFNIAGLQSAAVCVPDPVLRNIVSRGLNSDEVAEPNCFAVIATVTAFNKGKLWLKELNEYISENKRTAKEFLSHIPEVHLTDSDATYLLWIDCSKITDSGEDLCTHIRKTTGLYLSDGNRYRGNGAGFVRMNIACPRARLLHGLELFEKGISSYKK